MMSTYILGIESSCDDTSAAVACDTEILSNIIANQDVHKNFGGVVPELASRAHQQNIIPVIDNALVKAKINKNQIQAVAFTAGPGLLGSLLVGTSFAKAFALALNIPLIEVDHLQAHILAHFIDQKGLPKPSFPFLCLIVSGGHTQIVLVRDYFDMEVIGQTIDDAAGETFDKAAKILGLSYPGGPVIEKFSKEGNSHAFDFPTPKVDGLDFSFSGLKTSFLYLIRDHLKKDESFIEKNKNDLCASIQRVIIKILIEKIKKAVDQTNVREIAIAGGVSANKLLSEELLKLQSQLKCKVFIPQFEYTTDNAAMIAIAGYFKYSKGLFSNQKAIPYVQSNLKGS